MSECRLRQFKHDGSIETLTCDEVREKQYEMKEKFRKVNGTDQIMKRGRIDRMYVQYCESIDKFLNECKCKESISLKCEKCSEEDHEGYFCRCESRNIALAKQIRRDKEQTKLSPR